MKLNFIEDEAKSLTIEFEGFDRGIPDMVKEKLLENKDVDFAGVVKEHPELGNPRLVVKAEKNARHLVLKAVEDVQEELKELASQLPKK